ncbi:uncharacterized protein T551_01414 [Pneumocystis jirovecii RU7]|uniref:Vacuolar ATPase assembly protein VMA22 n=1 Tax=Pneumocystis jirovecii (strain RU7) TaxID=1408657 RepID=A0A0W4ZSK6_PNEJ7|nr:uncharacterized protein T551_01414 [Pneumocystis jirovecii RU7]KTW31342.1 hypothetical protein T551_01414 [Pneumocystis jirovecii RU7]
MNCKKNIEYLDNTLIQYFSFIDDYISAVSRLSSALKQGYFSIARANYLDLYVRGRFALLHGYNRPMNALYYVDLNSEFKLIRNDLVSVSTTKGKVSEKVFKDPLDWFGILVPNELREVQKHFQDGLKEVAHMAHLRVVLNKLEKDIILYRKEIL